MVELLEEVLTQESDVVSGGFGAEYFGGTLTKVDTSLLNELTTAYACEVCDCNCYSCYDW